MIAAQLASRMTNAVPLKPDAARLPGGESSRPAGTFYSNAPRENGAPAPGVLEHGDHPARDQFWQVVEDIAGGVSLFVIGYALLVFAGAMQ